MYEMQIAAVKRKSQVCSVEAHLSSLTPEEADAQGMGVMEYVAYSRFVLCLIDKTGSVTITPKANIPVADIFYIKEMKDIALKQKSAFDMGMMEADEESEETFSGKTVPFGTSKGKTIPEVASEKGEEELQSLRGFLAKNATKHAINQTLINDIDLCLKLLKDGKADAITAAPKRTITVYEQNLKYLSSNKDEDGRVFVYSIAMRCDLTKDMPWIVEVSNGYAPLELNAIGLKTPKASAMVGRSSSSMQMTSLEFCGLIDKMFYMARDYDTSVFTEQYLLAKELADQARANYKAAAGK